MGRQMGGYELTQQTRILDSEEQQSHRDRIRESADRQREQTASVVPSVKQGCRRV